MGVAACGDDPARPPTTRHADGIDAAASAVRVKTTAWAAAEMTGTVRRVTLSPSSPVIAMAKSYQKQTAPKGICQLWGTATVAFCADVLPRAGQGKTHASSNSQKQSCALFIRRRTASTQVVIGQLQRS